MLTTAKKQREAEEKSAHTAHTGLTFYHLNQFLSVVNSVIVLLLLFFFSLVFHCLLNIVVVFPFCCVVPKTLTFVTT